MRYHGQFSTTAWGGEEMKKKIIATMVILLFLCVSILAMASPASSQTNHKTRQRLPVLSAMLQSTMLAPAYVSVNYFENGKQTRAYIIPIEISNYLHENNLQIKDVTNNPIVTKVLQSVGNNKVVSTLQSSNLTVVNLSNMQLEYLQFVSYSVSLLNANEKPIFTFYTTIILRNYLLSNKLEFLFCFERLQYGSLLYWFTYHNTPIQETIDLQPLPMCYYIHVDTSVNVYQRFSGNGYHAFVHYWIDYVQDSHGNWYWCPDMLDTTGIYEI